MAWRVVDSRPQSQLIIGLHLELCTNNPNIHNHGRCMSFRRVFKSHVPQRLTLRKGIRPPRSCDAAVTGNWRLDGAYRPRTVVRTQHRRSDACSRGNMANRDAQYVPYDNGQLYGVGKISASWVTCSSPSCHLYPCFWCKNLGKMSRVSFSSSWEPQTSSSSSSSISAHLHCSTGFQRHRFRFSQRMAIPARRSRLCHRLLSRLLHGHNLPLVPNNERVHGSVPQLSHPPAPPSPQELSHVRLRAVQI